MTLSSLRTQLSLGLLVALIAIMATQLLIRGFVILPHYQAQEAQIDKQGLEQLKATTDTGFKALRAVVYDNAVWTEMVQRMAVADADFLNATYNDPDFYHLLNVNGIYFYRPDGDLVWGQTLAENDAPTPVPGLSPIRPELANALLVSRAEWIANDHRPVTRSGFLRLDDRRVQFVGVSIALPDEPDSFQGTAVFWRELDDEWLGEVTSTLRAPVTLRFVDRAPVPAIEADRIFQPDSTAHRIDDRLTLLYRDWHGAPILTLGVPARPRLYNDRLLDIGVIAELGVAALAIGVFYVFLNQRAIGPIHRIGQVVDWVSRTGNFGRRTQVRVHNEVGRLARQVDQMLALAGSQRQELLSHNHRLQTLSDTDPLTGLSNRRHLENLTLRMEDTPDTHSRPIGLLIVDIDHFKQYNDHYGHAAGDRALADIARLLDSQLHSATDRLARYGGEEFVILLLDTEPEEVLAVAERLRARVAEAAIPHARAPKRGHLTLSIGVATKPAHQPFRYAPLFNAADQALYRAKRDGRNAVRVGSLTAPAPA